MDILGVHDLAFLVPPPNFDDVGDFNISSYF